jgi:hypothetical protein
VAHLGEAADRIVDEPRVYRAEQHPDLLVERDDRGGLNIVPTHSQGTARLDAIQEVIAEWTRLDSSD